MRETRAVFARKSPVVPKANKFAVSRLVITHGPAKMAADVAESLDLPFVFVQKYVVVFDPARQLAGLF
jgi:hypothetical protein